MASTLKETFQNEFLIGSCVNTWQLEGVKIFKKAKPLIKKEFASITMENQMKPDKLLKEETKNCEIKTDVIIDTELLDRILSEAKSMGLLLRGHTLVWHGQTPKWFFREDYKEDGKLVDRETMSKRMENYIRAVIEYCDTYDGIVYAWDVVNEAIHDDGNPRDEKTSDWFGIYGDTSYINEAFFYARKYAKKDVSLFYNDYDEYNPEKRDGIYKKVKELYEEGNCDGVGMQSHYDMDYPSVDLIKEAIEKFNSIAPGKIQIQLTEMDMHNNSNDEKDQKLMAKRYKEIFQMLLDEKRNNHVNITCVTVWGVSDNVSWLSGFRKEKSYPLFFDENYKEKLVCKELKSLE